MLRLYSLQARYGLPVLVTSVACLAYLMSYLIAGPPEIGYDLRYFGFGLAVLVSAILGGLGPGLLATGLAALASAYFLLPPVFSLQIASSERATRLLLFAGEGVLLSFVGYSIRESDGNAICGSKIRQYFSMVLFVCTAVIIKFGIGRELQQQFPFSLFYVAIAVSAWAGGIGPGVGATLLSSICARYFFLEPRYSLSVASRASAARVLLFMLEGLVVSLLSAEHSRTRRLLSDVLSQVDTYAKRLWKMVEDARALKAISRDVIWEWDLSPSPAVPRTVTRELPEKIVTPVEFTLWLQQIHPKDRLNVITSLRLAVEEGQREWFCEYRRLRPEGGYIRASDHAYIIRDAAWNAVRVIGRSADVTEAMQTAQALKNTDEYHAVFASNPVATLLVDSALHVVEANEAACDVFGYTSREFARRHLENLFEEASRGSILQVLLALESNDAPAITFDGDCIRADGELFRAKVNAAMILDIENGAADRIITVEQIP